MATMFDDVVVQVLLPLATTMAIFAGVAVIRYHFHYGGERGVLILYIWVSNTA
jgi:hypothetical protein